MKKTTARRASSSQQIDENTTRLCAFFSIVLALAGIFNPLYWILLTIDITLRVVSPRLSPISYFSSCLTSLFRIKPKPVAVAPKKFAAQIALLLMLLVLVFKYCNIAWGTNIALGMLIIALSLFAFFNFCFACVLYPIFSALTKK